MKTLIYKSATLSDDGKSVTINADVVEQPFNSILTSRVTHGHLNELNVKHPRHVQSSSEAVFVKHSVHGVALLNDFLVSVAAVVEPKTSFAPLHVPSADLMTTQLVSESDVKYQWQVSDDPAPQGTFPPPVAVWSDIAGQTSKTLDKSCIKQGQWARCVSTNATGSTIGKPVHIK